MRCSPLKSLLCFSILLTGLFQSIDAFAPPPADGDNNGEPIIAHEIARPPSGTIDGTSCPVPPAFANVPALRNYVVRVCESIASVMDHKTGAGTGQLVTDLEQFRTELVSGPAAITAADIAETGLSYENIREFVIAQTGSKGQTVEVMAYSPAIAKANEWLQNTGFGFFRVVQHPQAAVLEAYRNATARFPATRGVTQDDVKAASDLAYPDNAPTEIRLPLNPGELTKPALALKFSRYHLVGDPDVASAELVPLPSDVDPLPHEVVWYRRMQAARFAITTGVMLTASYAAGGFTPESAAVFLTGLGLETQFIVGSKHWRKFWAWGGFYGNAFVNFSYGAILASVQHLTEAMQGAPITFDRDEFLIRTGVLGATFIASFGGMQVVSARMKNEGEFSEGKALNLESYGNIINNFGRFFATVAAMTGAGVVLGNLGPVEFGTNTAVGWGIQGAFLALVTAPLWFKRMIGDGVRAGLVAYDVQLHKDPKHPYNGKIFGGVRRWCAEKVAAFTRFYTPRRVPRTNGDSE